MKWPCAFLTGKGPVVGRFNKLSTKFKHYQSAIIFLFFCLQKNYFIVCMHLCNNDEIFWERVPLCYLSNIQLEMNFTLNDRC